MYSKLFKKLSVMIFMFTFCILTYQQGFSFSIVRSIPAPHSDAATINYLRASVFVHLSIKDFEVASGQKLNFFQKIYFKIFQNQVRRDLKKNPDFLITEYKKEGTPKSGFSLLWFVIGSIIGPLGVLLAYTEKDRRGSVPKKNRLLPVWLGFIFFVIWFGFLFIF